MLWKEELSSRRRTCMLIVTHACNLNCSYCYESHKKNAFMNSELAKEIISSEAQFVKNSDDFDELAIDFMGGEPLLNFSLIKKTVEWLENGAIHVPWISYSTTNGTFIYDDVKAWLREHKHSFVLSASYDGTQKMQTFNRGNKEVDLDFFHELWPHQPFHMTISKETLPFLAQGVLDMQQRGFLVEGSLAQGVNWTKQDAKTYRQQLSILKDAYLKNYALKPFNLLTRFLDIDISATSQQEKWCGTGKHMVAYDIDGKKYGCHMFTPLVLDQRALAVEDVDWDSPKVITDDFCNNCVLKRFCPTCAGFNYRYRDNLASRDKRWCTMVLAEALTACEFQIERLAKMVSLEPLDAKYAKAALQAHAILRQLDFQRSNSPYSI